MMFRGGHDKASRRYFCGFFLNPAKQLTEFSSHLAQNRLQTVADLAVLSEISQDGRGFLAENPPGAGKANPHR